MLYYLSKDTTFLNNQTDFIKMEKVLKGTFNVDGSANNPRHMVNAILLPEDWVGTIDPNTINIQLTPIGYVQDLVVDKIEWGRKIVLKSCNAANIHCYYTITAQVAEVAQAA